MSKRKKLGLTTSEIDELASVISAEGFHYYFCSHESLDRFVGTELEEEVTAFVDANKKLRDKLITMGVDLEG